MSSGKIFSVAVVISASLWLVYLITLPSKQSKKMSVEVAAEGEITFTLYDHLPTRAQFTEFLGLFDKGHITKSEFAEFISQNRPDAAMDLNVLCVHKPALRAAGLGKDFHLAPVHEDFNPKNFPASPDCRKNAKKKRRIFTIHELLKTLGKRDRIQFDQYGRDKSWISPYEVAVAMNRHGCEPDKWPGLLAYGAAQDVGYNTYVAAIGYLKEGKFPVLTGELRLLPGWHAPRPLRSLRLHIPESLRGGNMRFIAVCD